MFTRFTRNALVATASAALLVAAPAFAQSETRSEAVRYGDLDLKSDDGVAKLDSRVRTAANSVCGVDGARTIQEVAQARKCAKIAMTNAAGPVQLAVAQARSNQGYASNEVKIRTGR
ncbi:hypothetical protein ACFB49_37200 [Sphingomonas sp. DBB INV C78]|uniref:UrcA family protein n=1 Tax=Sphingomonas sp. DBB INV C78 TaxID=3349434 RepID=UPI0036D3C9D0